MRASPESSLPTLPGVAPAVLAACLMGCAVLVLFRGSRAIIAGSADILCVLPSTSMYETLSLRACLNFFSGVIRFARLSAVVRSIYSRMHCFW